MRITPAGGDIDGDDFPEIITYSRDQHLYAWNHDGTLLPGWPVATSGRVDSPPTLADIDVDGAFDHIVCERGIYRPDGELIDQGVVRPVPIDLNNDGVLDILGLRTARSIGGKYLPGWPVSVYSSHSDGVGVVDIDGDADLEVLWSSRSNFLYAFHHNGIPVSGWPRWLVEVGDTAPAIADIDDDGDLEVVLSTGIDRIFVWDEPAPRGPHQIAWPMFAGGLRRTGVPEPALERSYGLIPPLSFTQKHLAQGDFGAVIEAYRYTVANTASSRDQKAESVLSIARIYNWRLQDDESAFREYEGFIEEFPESPFVPDAFLEMSDIYRYRLLGLQLQERFAGVTEQFRQILEASPEQPGRAREWFLLGNAYEVLGDDRQREVFEKIVNDYPDSYWAQISSLYLRYEGIAHHVDLEFWEDSVFSTVQQDIKEEDLLEADRSMIFAINSFSPAKQPFPCQVIVTTQLEPVEIQGPKYPFPRDPDLLVSWNDRSNVSGRSSQHELPNGDTVFTWDGAIRSNHLHTGNRGGGRVTTLSQPGRFVSDVTIERKYEKIGQDLQKCTVLVTSTWEPTVKVHRVAGIIDTTTPIPEPTWAIGDMIYWSVGPYRTEPEGISQTIEFSFVVKLPSDVAYFYPEIWVSPDSKKGQVNHPDIGKSLLGFECAFEGQTYKIASTRHFKIKEMESTVRRKYRLDAIIIGTR
jgi:tetratricopeptide (TPR) repeat protein